MSQTELSIDYESFCNLDITEVGASRYVNDPSARVLMCAWGFDDDPAGQIWVPEENQPMPRDLRDGLRDPRVIKRAWNANFEINVTRFMRPLRMHVDVREWRCTMVRAMTLSAPGQLGKAGPIFNLPADKQKDARGKRLIKLFCGPIKPTKKFPYTRASWVTHPREWEEFKEYCLQDRVSENEIERRTRKWDLPDHEWEMWHLDQDINDTGVPFNINMVDNAIRCVEFFREKYHAELKDITGVENTNSNPQLLGWLRENGYPFRDMKAGHIKAAFKDAEEGSDLKRVLELRMEASRTSVDKYYAFERGCDGDGRLRNTLQFAGAQRTWRWSGRLGQLQNPACPNKEFEKCLPLIAKHVERLRPQEIELIYPKPFDLLASAVRTTVQATKGKLLIDADLNAIENRVLGWIADDAKILGVFEDDRCPYIDFATRMFGEDYDTLFAEYEAGDKTKRTIAKPPTLGCGYMLSAGEETVDEETGEVEATGLLGYARNMGIILTPEQAELSVKVWRETFVDAVEFWWQIEKAAKTCVRTGEPTRVRHISFDRSGPFLRMLLPSKDKHGNPRCLYYCRPRLEDVVLYWCEEQEKYLPQYRCRRPDWQRSKTKQSLTYEGLNDKKQWCRISTHPGKITENADQAIARDVLAAGLRRAKRRGLEVFLHLHDQGLCLSDEDRAERDLEILIECMSEEIWWAKGLPLKAEGHISKIWIKT